MSWHNKKPNCITLPVDVIKRLATIPLAKEMLMQSSGEAAMLLREQKFWVVWNANTKCLSKRHAYLRDAKAEAMRLSSCDPGTEFYILRAVAKVTKAMGGHCPDIEDIQPTQQDRD